MNEVLLWEFEGMPCAICGHMVSLEPMKDVNKGHMVSLEPMKDVNKQWKDAPDEWLCRSCAGLMQVEAVSRWSPFHEKEGNRVRLRCVYGKVF